MDAFNNALAWANGLLYHEVVLVTTLAAGVLFTFWSGFSQYRALTHGVAAARGKYNAQGGAGAISHFQALAAALSATVGLGNIAGVAIAIMLGGPGAVLWMWIVGFFGMALKSTEVILSMIYRNVDDPQNPHGGPMWAYRRGLAELSPKLAPLGKYLGGLFCVCLVISAFTAGNIFQAFSVADTSREFFGLNPLLVGIVLAIIVGAVILGGIKRIGSVAGLIVPIMCGIYVLAGLYIIVLNIADIPAVFQLIFNSAFGAEAQSAFLGGTVGSAFLWGMKRALFSSEVGVGSSPVAHAAARSPEPVREGVVAGLEPFIDTLVVCTITALVILVSGIWNRPAEITLSTAPLITQAVSQENGQESELWNASSSALPAEHGFNQGDSVYMVVSAGENTQSGKNLHKFFGEVQLNNGAPQIAWQGLSAEQAPLLRDTGVYRDYVGATATAHAFNSQLPGIGKWIVSLAVLLFAISTMISWSYYGEQAMVYLAGEKSVMLYRIAYCVVIAASCGGLISTNRDLDNISTFGFGLLLVINIPLTLILAPKAMRAYKTYIARLKQGEFERS